MGAQPAKVEPRWLAAGPPYRLTRGELLRELRGKGYEITERQLRRWGELGMLPPPVRRVPPGATDGIVRALYPGWTLTLVARLLADIQGGARIADLQAAAPGYRDHLQATANDNMVPAIPEPTFRAIHVADDGHLTATETATREHVVQGSIAAVPGAATVNATATFTAEGTLTATGQVTLSVIPRVPRALQRALWKYVADFAERNATAVADATLTLRDEAGRPLATIPIAPPPAPRRKAPRAGGEQRPEFANRH